MCWLSMLRPAWSRASADRGSEMPRAGRIDAAVMDGMALDLPDASFDAALSVFGIILFPDAERGMREIARVLKPGGRAAIVTWTEPERYELAARLMAAIAAVRGPQAAPASLPAQLRYRDPEDFRRLLSDAGLQVARNRSPGGALEPAVGALDRGQSCFCPWYGGDGRRPRDRSCGDFAGRCGRTGGRERRQGRWPCRRSPGSGLPSNRDTEDDADRR